MIQLRPCLLIALLAAMRLGAGPAATAQPVSSSADSTIRVLVLGSMHLANPGQDSFNPRVGDVTTPERQAQIRTVVDSLMDFRPTAIAVEWPRRDAAALDSAYRAYRTGTHDLAPSEREQLGFRLAARSGHDHIHPIDHHDRSYPIDTVMAYAKAHAPSFVRYRKAYGRRMVARFDSIGRAPIGDMLRYMNDPRVVRQLYEPYMRTLEVGADSTNVGVLPVQAYYNRNLHIFANLTAVTEPGDNVIVIFGAGHSAFLRRFVEAHPGMRLVEPLDTL
ncbi:MAG: DUF5694 domain-containing protein [Salinivenus sp.]